MRRQRIELRVVFAVLAVATVGAAVWRAAHALPVPARTAQGITPATPEPPLADPPPGAAVPPGVTGPPAPVSPPVDPPAPAVSIRVRVPALAQAGEELEYRITVENCSRASAHHVLVRNPLPANAQFVRASPEPAEREPELRWKLGTLESCAKKEIVLVLKPTGAGEVESCARVQFEHGQCVQTRIARPALQVRKSGPPQVVFHKAFPFVVEVTNAGQAEAAGVVVTDTLPEGLKYVTAKTAPDDPTANPLTWTLGKIAPGQTRRVEYQAAAVRADTFVNKAVVTAAGGLRQEASASVKAVDARLALTKTGPKRRVVNRPATYQITVANTGSVPAANVVVTDDWPADSIEYESASAAGRVEGNKVRWDLGTLAPGARRTVELVVHARKPGVYNNLAIVRADPDLEDRAVATTAFETASALTFEIDKSADPLAVGGEATYTVRAINQGSAPATNVGLTIETPEEMKVLEAKGATAADRQGAKTTFAPLVTLAPGAEAAYKVTVQALKPGQVRLKVEMTADQLAAGPLRAEEVTTIFTDQPGPP
jgi:uncharacterized repeat protein (TIGR01451 family)